MQLKQNLYANGGKSNIIVQLSSNRPWLSDVLRMYDYRLFRNDTHSSATNKRLIFSFKIRAIKYTKIAENISTLTSLQQCDRFIIPESMLDIVKCLRSSGLYRRAIGSEFIKYEHIHVNCAYITKIILFTTLRSVELAHKLGDAINYFEP